MGKYRALVIGVCVLLVVGLAGVLSATGAEQLREQKRAVGQASFAPITWRRTNSIGIMRLVGST
jgi:hypothetical protein